MRRFLSIHNWLGFRGMLRYARDPVRLFFRYYLKIGLYPFRLRLRTPIGNIALDLYAHDDLITIHEIFFREDYRIRQQGSSPRTVVDFGANIGIAAAYFLSRDDQVHVSAYEPVPINVERARRNLAAFAPRFDLVECAIATRAGMVSFGVEATGRYGGIGLGHAEQIEVHAQSGLDELARIQAERGRIDMLKLDVEDMEVPILTSLSPDCLRRINEIVAECDGHALDLPGFTFHQRLSVAHYQAAA